MAKLTLETFKKKLGYDGNKVDEKKALEILEEIGINATNMAGETPLIVAAMLGRAEVLKQIITQVDNVDFKPDDEYAETALLTACEQRRLECIKLLVEAGADLDQIDRFNMTPLAKIFTNTFSDPLPSAEYLVSVGAKITDRVIEIGRDWDKEKFNAFLEKVS